MIWLVAIACFSVGVVIGGLFARKLGTNPSRVQELENQIRDLKDSHNNYRDNVSDHFSMSAELLQHMTESYREVYQHLASGAQDLCSTEVASKLLPATSESVFDKGTEDEQGPGLAPPKDYADKTDPGKKGALAEDFGLSKKKLDDDEPDPAPSKES